MAKVREDDKGLYVIAGGYVARPGSVTGYGHALRMDDGGLKAGDTVKARHKPQSQLTTITLPDGTKTIWHHEGPERDRGLYIPPDDAVWDANGVIKFDRPKPRVSKRQKPRLIASSGPPRF